MRRFEAHEGILPPNVLPRYASAVQRFARREDRFSARTLLQFMASAPQEGFTIKAIDDGLTEILIYDEIGYYGITAKDFVLALADIGPGPIRLRINSPGGDVFDGLAIYNALRARSAPVTAVVDGIAASAASVIAMAASTIEMPEQAMFMIHNCWGMSIGNRNDMLEMAAVMEKIDGQMAQIYAKKSGKPAEDMSAAMDAETYYTSTEAKAVGLCDTILDQEAQQALARASLGTLRVSLCAKLARGKARIAAAMPDYDPDGDGDNDAQEALTLIQAATDMLEDAADALLGIDDEAGEEGAAAEAAQIVVPGASSEQPTVTASHVEDAAEIDRQNFQAELERRRRRARLAAAEL